MEINSTLFGQMITFAIFVWFTMKFVWPVLQASLNERKNKIAEGLAAAERGHKELEIAQVYAITQIKEARANAQEIVDSAHKQATAIIEQSKAEAIRERDKIISVGHMEVLQAKEAARASLQHEVIDLSVKSAEKLLKNAMDDDVQQRLLDVANILKKQEQKS